MAAQTVTITAVLDQSAVTVTPDSALNTLKHDSVEASRSSLRRAKLRSSPDTRRAPTRLRAGSGGSTLRFGSRVRGVYQVAKVAGHITMDGLIDQSAVLYGPSFSNIRILPNIIDQSADTFEPNIVINVTLGLLDNSAVLYGMEFQQVQTVTLGLLSQLAVTTTPTSVSWNVAPQFLDNSATTFFPKFNQKVTMTGLIDQSAATFAPSSITAAVTLDIIDNSAETSDPAMATTKQLDPALLDQSAATFDPSVNQAAPGQVVLPLLDQSAVANAIIIHVPALPVISKHGVYKPIIFQKGHYKPTLHKRGRFIE